MNLLLRYVGHGIAISLLVFIMLAFNLSALARTSEKCASGCLSAGDRYELDGGRRHSSWHARGLSQ